MKPKLSQLDEIFNGAHSFVLGSELRVLDTGVDPLGMRQINLDLMGAVLPGINNLTSHIRPYAFMAWAWWRARQESSGEKTDSRRFHDRVLRYEVLYAWSRWLRDGTPPNGMRSIANYLPRRGDTTSFRFEGSAWERLKKAITPMMAPTQYGPSIKALGWLQTADGGTFTAAKEAEPAIHAIDAILAGYLPSHLLGERCPEVTIDDVRLFAERLPFEDTLPEEVEAFRLLYYTGDGQTQSQGDLVDRRETLDLLRSHLIEAREPLRVENLRSILARGKLPTAPTGSSASAARAAARLCILQARQTQRLATEAMLLWTETTISENGDRPTSIHELVGKAEEAAREHDELAAASPTVGDYLNGVEALGADYGWPEAAGRDETDIVGLTELIRTSQSWETHLLPARCLLGFAVAFHAMRGAREAGLFRAAAMDFDRRPERLPPGSFLRQVDELRARPLADLWRLVIGRWVIGQHVYWSVVRGGDGKNRLRVALEDGGWIRVRKGVSAAFLPTPDRLWTSLSLAAACGLLDRNEEEATFWRRATKLTARASLPDDGGT